MDKISQFHGRNPILQLEQAPVPVLENYSQPIKDSLKSAIKIIAFHKISLHEADPEETLGEVSGNRGKSCGSDSLGVVIGDGWK